MGERNLGLPSCAAEEKEPRKASKIEGDPLLLRLANLALYWARAKIELALLLPMIFCQKSLAQGITKPMHMTITPELATAYMQEALKEATQAQTLGEIPIGAIIIENDEILARAHNLTESRSDPTAHAEILCIQRAATSKNNWRLDDCVLCVTLEPCTMCLGAILNSRIKTVIFGTPEPLTGALGSQYDLSIGGDGEKRVRIIRDIMKDECENLLKNFFLTRRQKP